MRDWWTGPFPRLLSVFRGKYKAVSADYLRLQVRALPSPSTPHLYPTIYDYLRLHVVPIYDPPPPLPNPHSSPALSEHGRCIGR